jgi:predicted dehydrogenase
MNSTRRRFLKAGIASACFPNIIRAEDANPSGRLRVAVMGLSRGLAHIQSFSKVPNVEIAYVCDVDAERLGKGAELVEKLTGNRPQAVTDFRRILDDKNVDALSIATPNFWHAPATILACQAGKHVYVEKPGSYCAGEAERMVAVAAEHERHVQLGTQRRSYSKTREAIDRLKSGDLGTLRTGRSWYTNTRQSIGKGKPAPVPANIDYELWQGPAEALPYQDNLIHYNWHWFWHWGNGELGNNGVHALDIVRWGMGAELPVKATCAGGRYHFDDDQETPDTATAVFDFGKTSAIWEGSSCHPRAADKLPFVRFYGDKGSMDIDSGNSYRIYDGGGNVIEEVKDSAGDVPHFSNFADAIRSGAALNAPIADSYRSAMLCHYGNISYQMGVTVDIDSATGKITTPDVDPKLWQRPYRAGWGL